MSRSLSPSLRPLTLSGPGSLSATLARSLTAPLNPLKDAIREGVTRTFQGDEDIVEGFRTPVGDPGWFGPGSVVWTVHGDLPSMLVGGIAALLLQTLHPLAMAGVAEHSDYRNDPLGRLQRTAAFVGTTTFGSSAAAEQAVAMVREIHNRVTGTAPDGRPYSANDPELLTWVHTAEAACFLRSYRRFGPRALTGSERDGYFAEMSRVARALGATELPESWSAVRDYFRRIRPQLEAGPQALDAVDYVVNTASDVAAEEAVRRLVVQAAIGVLPPWARSMAGLRQPGELEGMVIDTAWRGTGAFLRWALGPSEVLHAARARARVESTAA